MRKVLTGKCFADGEEVKQKASEALKGIGIDQFAKLSGAVGRRLCGCAASSGDALKVRSLTLTEWALNAGLLHPSPRPATLGGGR